MPANEDERIARLLREVLREEAERVPLPPPEVLWERVKSRLASPPPRRRLLPALAVCAAAAIGLLILTGLPGPWTESARQQIALGPQSQSTQVAPQTLSGGPPGSESAAQPEKESGSVLHDAQSEPPAAAEPRFREQPEGEAGAPGEGNAAVPQEQYLLRSSTTPSARNHKTPRSAEDTGTADQAGKTLPFTLPVISALPAGLSESELTVEREEKGTVASLVYRGGESFLCLRVSDRPWTEGPETGEEVTIGQAVGRMGTEADRTWLRWSENGLYLELESNLPPKEVLAAARSLLWSP
ncbi:MAG: hypothetical protein QHH27_03425 [Clostridia bacterium]|jgi:hypothetical protein|nr:hypothetical protein [Clostridia bacterium]MDH7572588.1 hypothetical protein [Clostridia bacterium]